MNLSAYIHHNQFHFIFYFNKLNLFEYKNDFCPKTLWIQNTDLDRDLEAISEDFNYSLYESLITSKEKINYLISHNIINKHNKELLQNSIESDIFDAFNTDPQGASIALKIVLINDINISYNDKIGEQIIDSISSNENFEIFQFLILHYVLKNQVSIDIINSLTRIIYDEKTHFTSTMMNFTSKQIVHILIEHLDRIKLFLFDMLDIKPLFVLFIISSIDENLLSDEFINEFKMILMNLSNEI